MERLVDFGAANRVSIRVELKDIRLTDMSAKCNPKLKGSFLDPTVDLDCKVVGHENNALEIACDYRFAARAAEAQVAEATIKYVLVYEIRGSEPLIDEDLAEFALANGTLHSWPFLRELLYGLMSKMGYPPYILPVFHFKAKPQQPKIIAEKVAVEEKPSTPESAG